MFEKATVIAAAFVFIIFSIFGFKYYQFITKQNQKPIVQQTK